MITMAQCVALRLTLRPKVRVKSALSSTYTSRASTHPVHIQYASSMHPVSIQHASSTHPSTSPLLRRTSFYFGPLCSWKAPRYAQTTHYSRVTLLTQTSLAISADSVTPATYYARTVWSLSTQRKHAEREHICPPAGSPSPRLLTLRTTPNRCSTQRIF